MHPTSTPLYTRSLVAATDLTARRFVTTTGQIPAGGGAVVGVTRTAAIAGDAVAVDILGSTLVEAGVAVAIDADLTTDALGRAVAITDAATQRCAGRAMTAVAAAGQVVEILLLPR